MMQNNYKEKMMQYTRLARAISLTLPVILLAGCDDVLNDDVEEVTLQPQTLKFDPANGVIPYPNDIVGFDEDGTLKVPGETDWVHNPKDSPNTYWNYYGTQQGWGTSVPIVLEFDKAPEESGGSPSIDPATFEGSIKMFREKNGTLKELIWNKDFRAILAKAGSINIEPLKPFDEASRYFIALTTGVQDVHGKPLQASSAYKQLLSSNDEMGLHLQEVIDQLEGAGISDSSIIYAADFTTGSNVSVIRQVVESYLSEYSAETKITNLVPEAVPTSTEKNTLVTEFSDLLEKEGVSIPEPESTEAPEYRVFSATINLPAYLDTPEMGVNCDYNEYVDSMQEGGSHDSHPENFNEYRVAPQEFCSGAFSYFQTNDGTPINVSNAADIRVFKESDQNSINARIYLPVGEVPEAGFKVVMHSHGFGSSKDEAELFAEQLLGSGYAVIAIDHPLHGDRVVDIDGDGVADLDASVRRTDYASPENLLTTRGFMWQSALDYLGIRMAIANGVEDDQGNILLDTNNVHMLGGSLGGIHSTIISGMIKDAQENIPGYKEQLDLKTTTLNVPGAGVATVLMQSPVLLPELKEDILHSAAFRLFMAEKLGLYDPVTQLSKDEKVTALNKTDEYRNGLEDVDLTQPEQITDEQIRQLANEVLAASTVMGNSAPADFAEFEEQVWVAYETPAEIAYQAITDPSDPISYARVLAQYPDEPILLTEAVGDGSNDLNILGLGIALATEGNEYNPGDFVIVNQSDEMPLGGTDPLIRALGLDLLVGGENGEEDVTTIRGAARYGYGTHVSSFVPMPVAMIDPDLLPNDMQVHSSIVGASISFMDSNGSFVKVKNRGFTNGDDLLLLEEDFADQPEYKRR